MPEAFAGFDWAPVHGGSIAQAHRAVLPGGQQVIVKVQRPQITEAVDCDLSIFGQAGPDDRGPHGVGGLPTGWLIWPPSRPQPARRTRFRRRSPQHDRDGRRAGRRPEIRVPAVFDELCTPRVLVMERLHGGSVSDSGLLQRPGIDQRKLADILLRSALRLMMLGERFHADPHPGNVWLLDDGAVVGLLDFGPPAGSTASEQASAPC